MGAQLFYLLSVSVVKALFEPSGMSQDRGDHHRPTFRDTEGKLGCAPFGLFPAPTGKIRRALKQLLSWNHI